MLNVVNCGFNRIIANSDCVVEYGHELLNNE